MKSRKWLCIGRKKEKEKDSLPSTIMNFHLRCKISAHNLCQHIHRFDQNNNGIASLNKPFLRSDVPTDCMRDHELPMLENNSVATLLRAVLFTLCHEAYTKAKWEVQRKNTEGDAVGKSEKLVWCDGICLMIYLILYCLSSLTDWDFRAALSDGRSPHLSLSTSPFSTLLSVPLSSRFLHWEKRPAQFLTHARIPHPPLSSKRVAAEQSRCRAGQSRLSKVEGKERDGKPPLLGLDFFGGRAEVSCKATIAYPLLPTLALPLLTPLDSSNPN